MNNYLLFMNKFIDAIKIKKIKSLYQRFQDILRYNLFEKIG